MTDAGPQYEAADATDGAANAADAADTRTNADTDALHDADAAEASDSAETGGATAAGEAAAAGDADAAGDTDADASETDEPDLAALAEADPRTREELLAALMGAEHERDEYLDDLRRSHAEFENFRKRMTREGASQRDAGKAAVAESLLDVLDDVDRTLEAAGGSSDEALAKGVELVASKLASTLQGVGVRRIDEIGVTFDPSVHEAVQQKPAEEPVDEPRVAQVFRPGYAIGERTLRAAMVVVEQ